MTRRILATFFGVTLMVTALGAEPGRSGPSSADRPPAALLAAVAELHPDMRVVEKSDLNAQDCVEFRGAHPGWIAGDFLGDGQLEYAALLITEAPTKKIAFEGRTYLVHSARVVVLAGPANKRFEETTLYEFDEALPTIRGLALQEPKKIFDPSAQRDIWLAHPAVTFFSCGQFSVVYFWDGKRFDRAQTSN
jgi:hypothetical protein